MLYFTFLANSCMETESLTALSHPSQPFADFIFIPSIATCQLADAWTKSPWKVRSLMHMKFAQGLDKMAQHQPTFKSYFHRPYP